MKSIPVMGTAAFNQGPYLERLLSSVDYPVDQFIIILNGDDPELLESIDRIRKNTYEFIEELIIEDPGSNLGCAGGWNKILQNYPGDFYLITNDDIQFNAGDLKKFLEFKEDHPEYGMIIGNCWRSYFILTQNVFQRVGLFDENFYPCFIEDDDYHYRLMLNGIRTGECETIKVLHGTSGEVSSSTNKNKVTKDISKYCHKNNYYYYEEKWGGSINYELFNTPFDNKSLENSSWAPHPLYWKLNRNFPRSVKNNNQDYFIYVGGGLGDIIIHSYLYGYKSRFKSAIEDGHRIHVFYSSYYPFVEEWFEDIPGVICHKMKGDEGCINDKYVDAFVMENNPGFLVFPWERYEIDYFEEKRVEKYNTIIHPFSSQYHKAPFSLDLIELFDKTGNLFVGRNCGGAMNESLPHLKHAENAVDQLSLQEVVSYIRGAKKFIGAPSSMMNIAWWNSIPSVTVCSQSFAEDFIIPKSISCPYHIRYGLLPNSFRRLLITKRNNEFIDIDILKVFLEDWKFI
jgi:hypothetical protein